MQESKKIGKINIMIGRKIRKIITSILLSLFFSSAVFGQELTLDATTSKQSVSMGGTLTYTVTISGADIKNVPDPKLPDLSNTFSILSTSESSSFSWINGAVSSTKTKRYQLMPLAEGALTIGETTLKYRGNELKTNPVTITVSPALASNTQPTLEETPNIPNNQNKEQQGLGNIFLKSQTNKSTAYVGEEIILNLDLYRRIQLWSNVSLSAPNLQGFFVEDLVKKEEPRIETINGQRYYAFELVKKAIYPLKPGSYTIDSGSVSFIVNPFNGEQQIVAKPLALEIKPLPEKNKPKNFSGLVGDFSLSASFSSNNVDQNTPITLTLIISGSGNIRSIQEFSFPENPSFKIYQSKVTDEIITENGVSGKRTFEYIIIPKVSGKVLAPSFEINFFSPNKQDYNTLQTKQFFINVNAVAGLEKPTLQQNIDQLNQDINFLKPFKRTLHDLPLFHVYIPILLLLINLLLTLTMLTRYFNQTLFKKGKKENNQQQASNKAHAILKELKKESNLTDKDLNTLHQTILTFLSDKTGQSFLGLQQRDIKTQLSTYSIETNTISTILTFLKNIEFALFAPTATSTESQQVLLDDAQRIVTNLNKWRPKL